LNNKIAVATFIHFRNVLIDVGNRGENIQLSVLGLVGWLVLHLVNETGIQIQL
jgi:hypothetical protein